LKNDQNTLPFSTGKKVVVIGPNGNTAGVLLGNYLGQVCPANDFGCVPTVYDGVKQFNTGGTTTFVQGCPLTQNNTAGFAAAISAAKVADYVVLAMGIDSSIEGEDHDRVSIDLPSIQHQLIDAIIALNKPTVLVLLNGGMVGIDKEKTTVPAIIEAGYPGAVGAEAIARTIFGQNDHLGGKLPYTIYPADYISQVKMSYMEMAPKAGVSPGRTHRYYTGPVVYAFGYGLSYTKFEVTPIACNNLNPLSIAKNNNLEISMSIANVGERTGDEVIMVYASPTSKHNTPLLKNLISFKRVHLEPNQQDTLAFTLSLSDLQFYDIDTLANDVIPGIYPITFTNGVDSSFQCTIQVI